MTEEVFLITIGTFLFIVSLIQLGLSISCIIGQEVIEKLLKKKSPSPRQLVAQLSDYFLSQENEEGVMLTNALRKLLNPKRRKNDQRRSEQSQD
jgi:hypothetical protein